MPRSPFLFVTLLLLRGPAYAGSDFELSLIGGPSFPLRGLDKLVRTGYRVSGSLQLNLNDNIGLLVTSSYMRWKFDSGRVNTTAGVMGVPQGFDLAGAFESIPVMFGARLTFDGSVIRPYLAIMGGASFLRWTVRGSHAGGTPETIISHGLQWTEPSTSLDAGLLVGLGGSAWLDLNGSYTAFSNSRDRIESPQLAGQKLITSNTASQVAVQAGLRIGI
jgi:hypothetical protein